jgi:hypothetical protein
MADAPQDPTAEVAASVDQTISDLVHSAEGKSPPPPPPTIPSGGSSGSSSGSSSGGSSGSSGYDPNTAIIGQAKNVYFQLWGVYPPAGYIEKMVNNGMNIWEIADFERHKPAWLKTDAARKSSDGFASLLHNLGVV